MTVHYFPHRPGTHYLVPYEQLGDMHRRYSAMWTEVHTLRDIAARFNEEADEVAQLAVERFQEITRLRRLIEDLADEMGDILDNVDHVESTPVFDAVTAEWSGASR